MRYQLDDLTIDTTKKLVLRADERINVSGLSFDFLSFLLTKNTDVVSFDELISGVWAPTIVNEDTVTQRVLLLRNVLGDDVRNPRYIRSVRSRGYQLVASPVPVKKKGLECFLTKLKPKVFTAIAVTLCFAISSLWVLSNSGQKHIHFLNQDVQNSRTDPSTGRENKRLARAYYYSKIGQHDDNNRAIDLYQQVLLDEPGNHDAKIGLSLSYTADMCRYNADRQRAREAEKLAIDVIKDVPGSIKAHRALAYSYDCRGKIQSAKASYRRAIELDPNRDVKSQSSLAYLQGETGQLADALALNLYVSRTDPEQTFSMIQLARVYELLGLHRLAEPLYSESFELYPDNMFSNLAYPRHLFHQGKFAAAKTVLARAKSRPTHPSLLALSAELALIDGDLNLAQSELAVAAEMRPAEGILLC